MKEDNETVVENKICKFDSISVNGYNFEASNNRINRGYFCAYHHTNNFEEKILRPGQIQFFFKHCLQFNGNSKTDHYFAFVRWFKLPTSNQILDQFTTDDTSCWGSDFEDVSEDCILPVHKLYSGINLILEHYVSINVVTFLPRKII